MTVSWQISSAGFHIPSRPHGEELGVGAWVVGLEVLVGIMEGFAVGPIVGLRVPAVGALLGESVGDFEGFEVGLLAGSTGLPVGALLGLFVGSDKLMDNDSELCSTACVPRRILVSEARSSPR